MSEPVFQRHARGLTVAEIAALIGAALPAAAPARTVSNIASLDWAGPTDLCVFDNARYADAAAHCHAGACLTTAALARDLPARVVALVVAEPYHAFVTVARELFPHALRPSSLYPADDGGTAHVHATARLESGVTLEPGAVIGPSAEIGAGTVIGANAVIGPEVRIGRDCAIGADAAISNALIGDRVIIHAGCRIGQDGFGFLADGARTLKMPQVGRVIIQDNVEIGAGSAIDRGSVRDTAIGEGTKIDNLVQVGHNVSIGRYCLIAAQSGLSGSAVLEDFVALGGSVGVSDHAVIGEGAQLAAASKVHGAVPAGARWGGSPAKPFDLWQRELRALARAARAEAAADARDSGDG